MPLFYQGFGPTAILLMGLCLAISQAFKYFRNKKTFVSKSH